MTQPPTVREALEAILQDIEMHEFDFQFSATEEFRAARAALDAEPLLTRGECGMVSLALAEANKEKFYGVENKLGPNGEHLARALGVKE